MSRIAYTHPLFSFHDVEGALRRTSEGMGSELPLIGVPWRADSEPEVPDRYSTRYSLDDVLSAVERELVSRLAALRGQPG